MISLLSCLVMILSRSYKQKKGRYFNPLEEKGR